MKKFLLSAVALCAVAVSGTANAATYTYVGQWFVSDGPNWTTNPVVYSGQDAAALLFGGVASDYAISTKGNNAALIDFKAFLDGWADTQYATTPASESFKLDTGGTGYNSAPGFGSSYSAYVQDHYSRGTGPINYAFRIDGVNGAVPEPATWAMMLVGFGAAGSAMRYRRRKTAVSFS
jgi:PEP-CTERM motif